jgi:hypothetical protein
MFDIAPSTVLYWGRNFALKVYGKPKPDDVEVGLEMEEMWRF